MKQDYQLKITLHFLLASLAEQENNDQNTVLTCKRIGGGENLEFMSYMAYAEFEQIPPVTNPLVSKDSALALTVINAADTSRYWKGELDYTSPNVDLQTGTVTVRAILENPKEELLSGMYVKIRLPYKVVKDALLIPEASIGTGQAGRYVYLVDENNRVVQQTVKVGVLSNDGMREIVSGVTPDDRYVVEALMNVRPGMTVKPVREKTKR